MNQLIKLITNEQKNTYQVQTMLLSFGPISVGGLHGCSQLFSQPQPPVMMC